MTIEALAEQSQSHRGDPGPMFRIAIPSLGLGWRRSLRRKPISRDVQAEFQEHFDRDLKTNGNMDPNLTTAERDQVEQLQTIREAIVGH